jgi:hypothetical protein
MFKAVKGALRELTGVPEAPERKPSIPVARFLSEQITIKREFIVSVELEWREVIDDGELLHVPLVLVDGIVDENYGEEAMTISAMTQEYLDYLAEVNCEHSMAIGEYYIHDNVGLESTPIGEWLLNQAYIKIDELKMAA